MKRQVILLNGVSSSGKSSLAREKIKEMPHYFHFSIDDFDYVIEKMEDREAERLIPVMTEVFFHRNVALFADQGVSLVVDHVIYNDEVWKDWQAVLSDYPVTLVAVRCREEELIRREQARGDRQIGLALEQLPYVIKQQETHDVIIDTTEQTPEMCAQVLLDYIGRPLK